MINSMTGFAAARGALGPHSWVWELRSVNSKGLDLRLRVPDWLDGLESVVRAELSKAVKRGSLTLSLKISRGDEAVDLRLNTAALEIVLDAVAETERRAQDRGLDLAPSTAADLLGLRGLWDSAAGQDDAAPLVAQMKAELPALLSDFLAMRATEGAALSKVLLAQLDQVADLSTRAADMAKARQPQVAANLRTNLARVLDNSEGADPDRVAQELAMLAVKADVTEEIDRLAAMWMRHVIC